MSCELTPELSPPQLLLPHVTTVPSFLRAAKAPSVEYIVFTSASCELTPPDSLIPHVTTVPLFLRAAKAPIVEYIAFTSVSCEFTVELSPP